MGMITVVLWAAAGVWAQGQGKADNKERVKDPGPQAGQTQANPPAASPAAEKNAGKGKAAKQDDSGAQGGAAKQGEPQGKKGGKAAADSSEKGKGKGPEQKGQGLQKKVQNEQAKHLERQARLARIRELAVKKGDAEMIARVDKLIAKEQEVYGRKQVRVPGYDKAGKGASEQKQKADKDAKEGMKEQKKADAKPEASKKQ
jgi:hypothetical protein